MTVFAIVMIYEEEFEKMWQLAKARDKQLEEKWNALPEEEKKRLEEEFSDPFYERISDNPFGDDDDSDND